jgi:hypothetical protein
MQFGASRESYDQWSRFLEALIVRTMNRTGSCFESLIAAQIRNREDNALFVKSAGRWFPDAGLGVWPDRQAPRMLDQETLEDFDPDAPLQPLLNIVYRVSNGLTAQLDCLRTMAGTAAGIQVVAAGESRGLFRVWNELFLEFIHDRMYRSFPWYVPLLDARSLDPSADDLVSKVLRPLQLYIRESFEDNVTLIVSAQPLDETFEQLGCSPSGRATAGDEFRWSLPR